MFSADEIASYREKGYFVAKGLLPEDEIVPLLSGIDRLLSEKLGERESPEAALQKEIHPKILRLAERDRAALGRVYDAMRKLLPFWTIIARLGPAMQSLAGARSPGVVFRGCGIRLDLPGEDKWRSTWHQEYHSQMSSLDGVTAWFNLVPVQHAMGPVELLEGSHREGLLPVHCADPMNTRRNYVETFRLAAEDGLTAKYPKVAHETGIGDVVFLHFLVVHQSGWNRSEGRSRITCQVRYFDMAAPDALANDWIGGWQDGGDFTKVHPDKVLA
jgi:hypothetical protein